MADQEFDFIVVGAGTAGCLLANRLSADPANRVLLIEAGGRDNYHWIHIPVGYLYCIDNPRTDWRFRTERSEEHTSELQSRPHLVCRLLLEKKKKKEKADTRDC